MARDGALAVSRTSIATRTVRANNREALSTIRPTVTRSAGRSCKTLLNRLTLAATKVDRWCYAKYPLKRA